MTCDEPESTLDDVFKPFIDGSDPPFGDIFKPFFKTRIDLDCYSRKDDPGRYITEQSIDAIINHLRTGVSNAIKMSKVANPTGKAYIDSLIDIMNVNIEAQIKSKQCGKIQILTKELEIVDTYKINDSLKLFNLSILNSFFSDFEIIFYDSKDYLTHKDELKDLLNNHEEVVEEKPKESEEVIAQRRESVLSFEHPNNFVNEDGDYEYWRIGYHTGSGVRCGIKSLARAYHLRYLRRQQLLKLTAIEYDYDDMKSSRKCLHAELKAFYRIFYRGRTHIESAEVCDATARIEDIDTLVSNEHYDYDLIKQRIAPFKQELLQTQRVLIRVVRLRVNIPVATLVANK